MSTTRYRNVRRSRFTQVGNELLWNPDLTLQAKGLLTIFLSNSSEWELNMKEIIKRSKNGRDAHYNVVKELIEKGYFARVEVKALTGKFERMEYLFSDDKEDVLCALEEIKKHYDEKILVIEHAGNTTEKIINKKTNSEVPFTENQDTENADTDNQYINNTKGNNTNLDNRLDTEDTKKDLSDSQHKENLKKEYVRKAFYENHDKVPEELGKVFSVFCRSTKEAEMYYKSINVARLDVFEKALQEFDTMLPVMNLEDEPELLQKIVNTFVRVIRKVEKEQNINNPTGYLYKAVYKTIWDYFELSSINNKNPINYDWLNT